MKEMDWETQNQYKELEATYYKRLGEESTKHTVAKYDTVDKWVDWGGHTVTIDPIRDHLWIHPGDHDYHGMGVARGRGYDKRAVDEMQTLLARHDQQDHSVSRFLPATSTLESLPKMPSRRNGDCDQWRGGKRDLRDVGQLPSIMAKHWRGELTDVPRQEIERQIYEDRVRVQARVSDRSGVPYYGVRGGNDCDN